MASSIPFAFQTGIINKTSVMFSVFSFSGADVALSVDGAAPTTITMTGYGTDGNGTTDSSATYPTALFIGKATINIVARATLSVTQSGVTRLGATNPDYGDVDSKVIIASCDHFAAPSSGVGSWPAIRQEVEDGFTNGFPVQTIIMTDDHGYTSELATSDTLAGGSGRFAGEPQVDWTEYSRYLAYAAYLGLMATESNAYGYELSFSKPDRIWVKENLPYWTCVGDWELTNDPAENATLTLAQITTAKNAYMNTVGSTTQMIDPTVSGAFVNRVGALEAIAYDRAFNLVPLTQYYDAVTEANKTAANALLGADQLSGITGAIDSTSPFKMLVMSMGVRHITEQSVRVDNKAVWDRSWYFGAQQPLHDYTCDKANGEYTVVSEWMTLMGVKTGSICSIAEAYGAKVFAVHGDVHRQYEYYNYTPQTESTVEVEFLECSAGGVCAQVSPKLYDLIDEGYSHHGVIVNWLDTNTSRDTSTVIDAVPTYLSLEMISGADLKVRYMKADGVQYGTIERETVIGRSSSDLSKLEYRQATL